MSLILSSPAFVEGARIPIQFTCEGDDISPPLTWSGAPEGAKSFALFCNDPDAPAGTWHHWALFDIPAETDHLDEEFALGEHVGAMRQGITDFRNFGYGGPCPPPGHGDHHYHFTLMALDVETLDIGQCRCAEAESAARKHLLAEARLTGIYSR